MRHRFHQLYAGICTHPPLFIVSPMGADIVTQSNGLFFGELLFSTAN